MPIMEISVVPLGTASTSLSPYVAAAERALAREKGVTVRITAMGTIVEAPSVGRLLAIAGRMHRAVTRTRARRVYTSIKIDDRLDTAVTIEGKVASLERRLQRRQS